MYRRPNELWLEMKKTKERWYRMKIVGKRKDEVSNFRENNSLGALVHMRDLLKEAMKVLGE